MQSKQNLLCLVTLFSVSKYAYYGFYKFIMLEWLLSRSIEIRVILT